MVCTKELVFGDVSKVVRSAACVVRHHIPAAS